MRTFRTALSVLALAAAVVALPASAQAAPKDGPAISIPTQPQLGYNWGG